MRDRGRRLLAIFPHPDDEAYGCAGTLHRASADPDTATVLFCLTRGEASQMGAERGLAPDEVGRLREQRLVDVAEILCLDGLLVGDLPDARLAHCPLAGVAGAVAEAIRAFRPQVVIGHDPRGVNAHPDHIATHWAIRSALQGEAGVRFAMLAYTQEVVDAVRPRLLFPTPEDEIDAVVHLTGEEIDAKERCLRIHEALVTLVPGSGDKLMIRPPVERYAFLGEDLDRETDDLFANLRSS